MHSFLREYIHTPITCKDGFLHEIENRTSDDSKSITSAIPLYELELESLIDVISPHKSSDSIVQTTLQSLIQQAYRKNISPYEQRAKKQFIHKTELNTPSTYTSAMLHPLPLYGALNQLGNIDFAISIQNNKVTSLTINDSALLDKYFRLEKSMCNLSELIDLHEKTLSFKESQFAHMRDETISKRKESTISLKPCGNNIFLVQTQTEPYAMHINEVQYIFPKINTGFRIKYTGSEGIIAGKPTLLGEIYAHPFVYSSNEICFDEELRWKQQNISFKKRELDSSYDLATFAKDVAYVASESIRTLRQGYAKNVIPVNELESFSSNIITSEKLLQQKVLSYDNF